jgi:methylenetetrahydrofolate reductase (NADPH)
MELVASVRALACGASIEITPRESPQLPALAAALPAGTRVYVAAASGSDPQHVVQASRAITAVGLTPVPHVVARAFADGAAAGRHLAALTQAGVGEVLVVAGSQGRPVGRLTSSLDLLRAGLLDGFTRVGVAGYPEGCPDVPAAAVRDALLEKQDWARASGVEVQVVSQFAFDATAYVDWVARIRSSGVTLPVVLGVPGVVGTRRLLGYAVRCGVGPSLRVLRRRAGEMTRLAAGWYRPDELVLGLARDLADPVAAGVAGLHLYPFGAGEATATFIRALQAGSLVRGPDGAWQVDTGG